MAAWVSMMGWMAAVTLSGPPASEPPIVVDGLVRLMESVDVPARSEGRLAKVLVKEGHLIKQGEILSRLDDAEVRLTLKRAQHEEQLAAEKAKSESLINSAKLTKTVSRAEFDRAHQAKLAAKSSISTSEYERLRLEAEKASNELERLTEEKRFAGVTAQIKSVEVELARLALAEHEVVAPLDGIVVQVHRREGEWVHQGDKVIRVVRIDRLRVEAFVNLSSKLALIEGAPTVLQVEFPDSPPQEFTGEVVFVNPEGDPVNGQIRIWAEIENRDRLLRPGQRGRLKIVPLDKPKTSSQTATKPAANTESR